MTRLPARAASVLTVVFGALLLATCASPERLSGPRESGQQPTFSAAKKQDIKDAIAAQERHKGALHKIKGVVGTAVGLLPDGRAAVQVLVLDATPRDIPAVLGQTRDVVVLEDGDFAVIRRDGVQITSLNGLPVKVRFEWSDTTTDTPQWTKRFR